MKKILRPNNYLILFLWNKRRAFLLLLFFVIFLLQEVSAQTYLKKDLALIEKNKLVRLVSDANKGYDTACYKLGMSFLEGKIVRQSYSDAIKWFSISADQGHVHSMYTIAMLYARGQGVKTDLTESFKWVKKLAEKGHRMAQYNLGKMYQMGHGTEKNEKLARQWYMFAAKRGSPSAIHELMSMERADFQVFMSSPINRENLIHLARSNDPKSQYLLGKAYYSGIGIEKNEINGRQWILEAAKNGYAEAQYTVAYLFPIVQNSRKESYVFQLEWTKKAAEKGHLFATFNLGGMYETGNGVDKDWSEAGRWYIYSAGLGNANAIKRLHMMAEVCSRFPERIECKGFKLRNLALENDSKDLFQIGLAFKDGDGLEQNYSKSLFWLKLAAGRNSIEAQYELADMYENALGVSRSIAQAKFWYEKAVVQGHKESAIRLEKMKESMGENK